MCVYVGFFVFRYRCDRTEGKGGKIMKLVKVTALRGEENEGEEKGREVCLRKCEKEGKQGKRKGGEGC